MPCVFFVNSDNLRNSQSVFFGVHRNEISYSKILGFKVEKRIVCKKISRNREVIDDFGKVEYNTS